MKFVNLMLMIFALAACSEKTTEDGNAEANKPQNTVEQGQEKTSPAKEGQKTDSTQQSTSEESATPEAKPAEQPSTSSNQ